MRVALAQTVVHRGQRSRNLAALTSAVTSAARLNPAPDLILLPDGAEQTLASTPAVNGGARGAPHALSAAMCQGFVETLAWTAREWGVWIVAGHVLPQPDGMIAAVTLFDPDGDPYLRFPDTRFPGFAAAAGAVRRWSIRATPLGTIGLGTAAALAGSPEETGLAERTADLLVIALAGEEVAALEPLQRLAQAAQSYICLVNHCGAHRGGGVRGSVILNRDGTVLAQSAPGTCATVVAELAVTPPSAAALNAWEEVLESE